MHKGRPVPRLFVQSNARQEAVVVVPLDFVVASVVDCPYEGAHPLVQSIMWIDFRRERVILDFA